MLCAALNDARGMCIKIGRAVRTRSSAVKFTISVDNWPSEREEKLWLFCQEMRNMGC